LQISIELLAGGADAVPVDAQNAEVTRLKVRGHSFSQAYIPPPGFNLLCALQLECSAALETLRTETEVRSVIALIEQCKFLEDIEDEDEDEGAGVGAGAGAGAGAGEGNKQPPIQVVTAQKVCPPHQDAPKSKRTVRQNAPGSNRPQT
jgi:hypothetical protein